MKKLSVLGMLILVAMFSFTAKADIITLDGANEIANAFFANSASSQKKQMKSITQLEYAWDSNSLTQKGSSMMKSVDEDPTFYVFNNPDGEGFVIVSGDDNARSVIGYSYEGNIPAADEIPAPMQDYLLGIDEEIKWARTNLTSSNKNLKSAEVPNGGNIVKYIETALWNQHSPFNKLCPNSSLTGCVPTAFAIVMRHHQWPAKGKVATLPTSDSPTVDLSSHTYDWSKMPMSYSSYTTDQADAVAQLMYDLGVSMGATYGSSSTDVNVTTNIGRLFCQNFDYLAEDMCQRDVSYVGNVEGWIEKIKSSINAGCPIPYSGSRAISQGESTLHGIHMFVLDGYTDNNYFHFNWAFGDGTDGWYTLDTMGPEGFQYIQSHKAFFNLRPNATTYPVTATANPSSMGTVSVNMGTAGSTASAEMFSGATATLTAYPADGYALASWTKNGVVVGSKNTIEVKVGTSDNDYVANFDLASNVLVVKEYTINPNTVALEGTSKVGTVTYKISDEYPVALSLTSTKTDGTSLNSISKYSDEEFRMYAYDQVSATSSIKYTLSVPDEEEYVITEYRFEYYLNSTSYPCSISCNGVTTQATEKAWHSLSPVVVNAKTVEFTLTAEKANASSNLYVRNLIVSVAKEGGVTPPSGETVDIELYVSSFEDLGEDELNNNCTVSSNVSTAVVGSQVVLTATTNPGYKFDGWSLDGETFISTEKSYRLTITSDMVLNGTVYVFAAFSKDNTPVTPTQYTVTVSTNGTGGTATVDGQQTVTVDAGTKVTIEAKPADGYEFDYWIVNGEQNSLLSAKETPTVNSNLTLVANFRATSEPSTPTTVSAVPVFTMGENGFQYYRIPALVETANGTLVAIADNRGSALGDLPNIISIVAKTSTNGGQTWSDMKTIAQGNATAGTTYGDAAAVYDEEIGKIITIFVGNENYGANRVGLWESNSSNILRLYQSESSDNGASWTTPKDISSSIYSAIYGTNASNWIGMFAGSGSAVQLKQGTHKGRLMFVVAARTNSTWGGAMSNYAVYSDDHGATWQVSSVACTSGDEAKIVELSNGDLLMSIKNRKDDSSNGTGYRLMAKSTDQGASWTPATVNNNLMDPACNGDVVSTTYGGTYYLLHSLPASTSTRENVTIYISSDNGQTWPISKQVYSGYSAYSSLEVLNDGTVGIIVEEGKWDDNLPGSNGFNLKYYSYTMAQLLNQEADPSTLALIETAKELKALEGVGYPNATAKATLQSAIATAEANPTAAAGTTLQTAITAYKNSTEIQKVEVGKAYAFVVALNATTSYYIYNNGTALALETYTEGTTELPETAYFTCAMNGDKYTFRSVVDNKYMAIPQPVVSWLVESSVSTTGLVSSVTDVAKFTVEKLVSGMNGNVSTGKEDELFGKIYLNGTRGTRTDNGNLERGVIVVNSSKAFDKSNDPYYNGSVTSAIKVIERANTDVQDPATLALIETAKELKALEGVGYPNATAKATLQTAINTYKSSTDIVKPEAGKTYVFINKGYNNAEYYVYNNNYNNNGTLAYQTYNEGTTELPETAKFICEVVDGDYKYMFKTSDGKYMAFPSPGKDWLHNKSEDGIEETAGNLTKFDIRKIVKTDRVQKETVNMFGQVYFWGFRGNNGSTTGTATYGSMIVKPNATQKWDAAGEPYYDSTPQSSAFMIIEVASTPCTARVNAGNGGKATVNGSTSVTVNSGTQVTYTATANDGYRFTDWSNGTTTVSTENPYTVTVTSNIELTANFQEDSGEVEAPDYCTPSGSSYSNNYLTSVTTSGAKENISYSASSHPGGTYKLVDGVIKVNPGTSFTLNLVAYSLGAGSTTTVREDIRFCHASLFTDFDINGDFGDAVQTWGNKPPTNNVYGNYDQCIDISKIIDVPSNAAIGKSHIRVIYTNAWTDFPTACTTALDKGIAYDFVIEVVAIPTYTVTVSTNGDGGTATTSAESVQEGGTATLTATPAEGYKFTGWSDGSKANPYTVTVTDNISLVANFEAIPTYTVNVSVNGNGSVEKSAGSVLEGNTVTLTATPAEGYKFTGWSDGSTENPYTVTVTDNISLVANFEAIPTYTVNVSTNDVNGGTATASSSSVLEGNTVTLTATAADGYKFTGWSDGSKDNPYTLTVTEDISLTANFAEEGKLLLTFACLSDLHSQNSLIEGDVNSVDIRGVAKTTLQRISEEEKNLDLIVLGGDYTSDCTISEENWQRSRELLIEATRNVFPEGAKTPVIYVNGNHEYEVANFDDLPKYYNAGEYYGTPMKTDIGELPAEDCFYEEASNGTGTSVNLLAAYHYVVNGFDFVVLNTGKNMFTNAWTYEYSVESVQWCARKLAKIYEEDANKTVFFLVHIPFSDSNSLSATNKGMNAGDATTLLKSTLAQYPNLVMLYGHDHGTNSAYIRTSTSQRVTEYATDGSVYTGSGASQENIVYYVQNYDSREYLGYNSENLATTITQTSDVNLTSSTVSGCEGAFLFNMTNYVSDRQYVHCGSSDHNYSGNVNNSGVNQQIYLYKVADPTATTITATLSTTVEDGATYILVARNSATGTAYYALSDEVINSGETSQRMIGVEVTVTDGTITYNRADYNSSLLWTINEKGSSSEKSFFSSFMGSMRYYNNSIDGSVGASNSRIVQALMVYVYSDRVELKMKNYGESGTFDNGNITINKDLKSYVSYRTVTHSEEQVTATPVITSTGGDVAPNTEVTVTVYAPDWHNLYYTINGDTPTEASTKVENGQITFTTDAEVEEYVVKVAAQEGVRLISTSASVTYRVLDTHGITVSATEGGTAEFSIEGDKVTLTATPATGYNFVSWTLNSNVVATTAEATIAYTENAQYVANFAKQTFNVTVTATEGGSVNTITDPVEYGTTLTLTATPNDGYQFVNWTLNGTVVSTDATFTTEAITAEIQYVANFQEIRPEDIYADICKPGFTHGGNNNNTYISAATINGESITVPSTTTPANNYGQKQEGATEVIPVYKGIDYQLDLTFVTNWGDIRLYQIINGNTDVTPIYGPYEGSWASGRDVAEVMNEMANAGITVNDKTASFPLSFNNMNIGDLVVVRAAVGNVNTPCTTGINEGGYVDFLFVVTATPVRTVKIATNDTALGYAGYVTPQPQGTVLDVTTSEPVTVMAYLQPDANSRFVNWTIGDDVVGTDPTYTYYGTESVTIKANFAELAEVYSVNVSSNNRTWGSAKKSVSGSVAEEGTIVTFTATAYEGYEFVEWQNAQGSPVSNSASYTMVISSNTTLTAIFQETNGLTGRWYRIKEVNSGKYLNAANYTAHTDGAVGGVNAVAKNNSNDQIFKFVASGTNYTLKTRSGYNIVCQQWNVDALTSAGTVLRITETTYNSQKAIKINIASPASNQRNGAFKIQQVSGTYYPFCDANNSDIATWILEPVKISEVYVEKTSDNATIKVTTDQAATIKVGGSAKATNATSATVTIGATDGNVGDNIKVESIDGYITSIECIENIELTDVPVTVTEIALRNTSADEVTVNAPALSKITVVSDADNNVAKVSRTSDLSQGVQVVVEKEINVPHVNATDPTYFNFLSMPFAFNTANIEYLNGTGGWSQAILGTDILVLMYDSQQRANKKYDNTWRTLQTAEDIAANQGFVIVGNSDRGDTNLKMKLRFTSATEAYDGSETEVTAYSYRKQSGATSEYDTDWNFNGVPYLTNGVMNGYTLYFHNGYSYEAVSTDYALEEEKVISAYQGVMYQANIESGSRDIYITPSSAKRVTKASDDVFARAYISVDDAAPAKIILSDESSENFVVNEDAWYLAPTANAEAAAYFNIDGANASVTVQPAASELPMTVYTGAGSQHRITLTTTDGNYDVYLKDAVTDEVVCLNNEDYTFTATANKTIANRFTVSMVEPTGIIDAARAEGTIKVVVAGDIIKLFGTEEGDQVALYTANGMLIANTVAEDGVTTVPTSVEGVIIIKVADQTVKVVK